MPTVKAPTVNNPSKHKLPTGKSWSTLSHILSKSTINTCVKTLGFPTMTAVQSASIPSFLSHKDLCVQAVTGSGKTLSFVIPMIEILTGRVESLKKSDVGGIILTPTRELAQQIDAVVTQFTADQPQHKKLTTAICIGGKNPEHELAHLQAFGAHIMIATPGRLDALLKSCKFLNFRTLEVLILDEADRLLEFGYQANINSILQSLPKQRRTGLFSATLTEQVEELAHVGLRNPVKITLKVQYKRKDDEGDSIKDPHSNPEQTVNSQAAPPSHQAIPSTLTNYYTYARAEERLIHLVKFLLDHKDHKIMVFFLTCADVDYFYRIVASYPAIAKQFALSSPDALSSVGLSHLIHHTAKSQHKKAHKLPLLCDLHGQMKQSRRERIYQQFRDTSSGVLFCTDVAARGIDIPDIDWVIQFSAPQNPEFFIHRIGRAARAGQQGHALVYLLPSEDSFVELMQGKHVPMVEYPHPLQLSDDDIAAIYTPAKEEYYPAPIHSETESDDDSDDLDEDMEEDDNDLDEDDDDDDDGDEPIIAKSKVSGSVHPDSIPDRNKLALDEDQSDGDITSSDRSHHKKAKHGDYQAQDNTVIRLSSNSVEQVQQQIENLKPLEGFREYREKVFYNEYKLLRAPATNDNKKVNKKLEKQLEFKKKKQDEIARKEAQSHRLPPHIRARLVHDTTNVVTHARYVVSYDRHLFDIGAKAYVSHINAYKEHQCKLIFVFDHLPFVHVALGYGLLILPQLPDLKKYNLTYPRITRIDHRFIPFHNDSIEVAKQKQLEKRKKRNELERKQRLQREADRAKYRERQKQLRDKKHKNKVKKTFDEFKQEYDELAEEYRKMKKSKRKR